MQRKMKTAAADPAALPQIPADLLETLIPGPVTPEPNAFEQPSAIHQPIGMREKI